VPAPHNERQTLERERAELLRQMADWRQELENAPVLRKGRRERLDWQIQERRKRLAEIERGLGAPAG
jgi:hypothetical protein